MTTVVHLPDVLLLEICSKWIDLLGVAKFDCSLTNKKHRHVILQMMSANEASFDCKFILGRLLFNWIEIRNVKVTSLLLKPSFTTSHDFSRVNCSRVRSIDFTNQMTFSGEDYVQLVNLCPNLTSLELTNFAGDMDLSSCFSLINTDILTELTTITNICGNEFPVIQKYCPNLTSIAASNVGAFYEDSFILLLKSSKYLKRLTIKGYLASTTFSKLALACPILQYFYCPVHWSDGYLDNCIYKCFKTIRLSLRCHMQNSYAYSVENGIASTTLGFRVNERDIFAYLSFKSYLLPVSVTILDISSYEHVHRHEIVKILTNNPNISILHIKQCDLIDSKTIVEIICYCRTSRPSMKIYLNGSKDCVIDIFRDVTHGFGVVW